MRTLLTLVLLLLLATHASAVSVSLQWDYDQNPLEPATAFVVYRDPDCLGVFFALATIPYVSQASQAYTDSGPFLPGHSYCFHVTATAADGRESGPSNTAIFLLPQSQPAPHTPFNLRGTALP